jgi:ferredoxin
VPQEPEEARPDAAEGATETVAIQLGRQRRTVAYEPGDTVLEAARRSGLAPPFACQAGNCGTCIAFLVEGEVAMRSNNVLDAEEVEEGWILTCQAVPKSRRVSVDYDR